MGFTCFPIKKSFWENKTGIKKRRAVYRVFLYKGNRQKNGLVYKKTFVKNGTFTPPFHNKDEITERLHKDYKEAELWNKGSIVCFRCKK
jgi:hypothetical protein